MAEGDGGNVDVRRFSNGLVVSSGISQNQEAGLNESSLLDLIGEGSGSESSRQGGGSGETSEFEGSSLTIRTSRDHTDISGIFDGSNDSSCESQFFPGLLEVNDVVSIGSSFPHVAGHGGLEVLGAQMNIAGEHFGDVIFFRVQCRRKLTHCK